MTDTNPRPVVVCSPSRFMLGAMTFSTVVGRFRIFALAEAISWAGLLLGMFFKYVVVENEIGVKVFGPIHGALFVAYLVALVWVAVRIYHREQLAVSA